MNFESSKDESLLVLWESVRGQVMADQATGGRHRVAAANVRVYADQLRSQLDKRGLRYAPIQWQ